MAEAKRRESLTETEKAFDCGVFMAGIILQRLHDCPEIVADLWLELGIDPSSDHGADLDDGDRAAIAQIIDGRPALVARAKPLPGYGG
ncbi:hypothetical protein EU803_14920 [Loktanella sp. IMCC34160]|uniref:hypothetical protein n=1 Tax=Loktanella sp. IMCC34160 TaxID=2510646 RepID=UPI00101D097C|nr:hypothetical protein [Loktanella sp. IMCC34160]RYG89913.1 hypothetical protein EU803_14920 [Loktanella sp. IMCC34160]